MHWQSGDPPPLFSLDLPCQVCSTSTYLIHSHLWIFPASETPIRVTSQGCPYRRTKVSKSSGLLSPLRRAAPATTMTPNPTRNSLPPLNPIISDHLDRQLNVAVTNLQRLITDAFNTRVRPLQQEIMDLQAQLQSNGPTQSGPTSYKANLPTPYDGSRQNGEGFIKACCLYHNSMRDASRMMPP